ncbi:rhodanese-like domain-containing protein, partial [Staphylococcus aureus]|nr:rhodanese-like domain-containing protein [Staphylococcus aureus]
WWLLTLFGASNVALLDGGLEAWAKTGHPVITGAAGATETPGLFVAQPDLARVRTLREVRAHVEEGDAQIVDARSPGRFTGREPEPRLGVEPGHIPGALNLPYNRMFEGDGRWTAPQAIAAEFAAAGVDPARPMVATCGSGITACVLAFGAERIGGVMPVYDGSWTEWGSDPSTPKAKDL